MQGPNQHIRAHGEAALNELDQLQSGGSVETKKRLDEIIQRLIAMRDALIEAGRAGQSCGDGLPRTNAILSSLFGTEFPKAGLQWKRVCESREALRNLLQSGSD